MGVVGEASGAAGRSADVGQEESLAPALLLLFGLAPAQIFRISLFTNKLLTDYFTAVIQRLIAVCEVLITLWEVGLRSSG